jgi:hypothetical protein
MAGLVNSNGTMCHILALRNALKCICAVMRVCRTLPHRGLGTIYADIFLDRAGRFDLSALIRGQLVARSGTVFKMASGDEGIDFTDSYFDAFRDPADDFDRLLEAAGQDASTRAFVDLFRGQFSRMLVLADPERRCAPQIGPVPNALRTALHSDNFATAEEVRHWPNEPFRCRCSKCRIAHEWGGEITVLEAPQVWAFQFLGARCQMVCAPLDFQVLVGEGTVSYSLASYVRINGVEGEGRHCTALVRRSGTAHDARIYDDRKVRDGVLPIIGEGSDVVNDRIVMAFYVRLE